MRFISSFRFTSIFSRGGISKFSWELNRFNILKWPLKAVLFSSILMVLIFSSAPAKSEINLKLHVSVGWGWALFYRYAYCEAWTYDEKTDRKVSANEITCHLRFARKMTPFDPTRVISTYEKKSARNTSTVELVVRDYGFPFVRLPKRVIGWACARSKGSRLCTDKLTVD